MSNVVSTSEMYYLQRLKFPGGLKLPPLSKLTDQHNANIYIIVLIVSAITFILNKNNIYLRIMPSTIKVQDGNSSTPFW